jgi:aspartyl-tRNA(Asn)/glutamyl-tRNA(Gln) amidotransferase subunit A
MDQHLPRQPNCHLVTARSIAADVLSGSPARPAVESALGKAHIDQLNAFISVDDSVVETTPATGPLAGVPIAIKDIIHQAGHTTTCGSSFYRYAATESATVVSRLEAAGAVIIGRTGLHEFAFGFSSENPWYGPVLNPWNTRTSPGGSSGGSAAAVAGGIVPISLGTDTGGSVRVPAALCGIYGLKSTHGRIPITGVFPLIESLDTVGSFAINIGDLATVYRVLAGYDPRDAWSVPDSAALTRPISRLGGLRVGVPQPWVETAPMEQEVRRSFEHALESLENIGATVIEVRNPFFSMPGMIGPTLAAEVSVLHGAWMRDPDKAYGEDVVERINAAMQTPLEDIVAANRWRSALTNTFLATFDQVDVLVTPTVPARTKYIGEDMMRFDGQEHFYRMVFSWFSALVNHAGLPALAAPLVGPGSPPPSIQIIGPPWSEDRLLEIGQRLEDHNLVGFRAPAS